MPNKPKSRRLRWAFFNLSLLSLLGSGTWLWVKATSRPAAKKVRQAVHAQDVKQVGGMVEIPAGRLALGSHFATSPADRPLPTVQIDAFWMDATEVTNRQYAEFVAATGYLTQAEREGSSDVFDPQAREWKRTEAADWRHPQGKDSSIAGRENFPVVQVTWQDAAAYARWAGKRLPSEYEWEYAARGGLYDADFPWGREETPGDVFQANTWQGWFPDVDRATDGHADLAAVGSYLPNRYGLVDMAGNVWEWCADEYQGPTEEKNTRLISLESDLAGPTEPERETTSEERRIRRGGSWLCCENYSLGMRLSSRSSVPVSTRSNHLGFRCVSDQPSILTLDTAKRAEEQTEITR